MKSKKRTKKRKKAALDHFLSVVMPTTTLLTNLPLSSTDMGFSTTTVWLVEVDGIVPVAFGLLAGSGHLTLPV